jgi:hypothetical protein
VCAEELAAVSTFFIISIDSVCVQKKRADQSHFKREFTEKVVSPPSWKIGRPRKKLVGGAAKISASPN